MFVDMLPNFHLSGLALSMDGVVAIGLFTLFAVCWKSRLLGARLKLSKCEEKPMGLIIKVNASDQADSDQPEEVWPISSTSTSGEIVYLFHFCVHLTVFP